jgi:hypothetical protein
VTPLLELLDWLAGRLERLEATWRAENLLVDLVLRPGPALAVRASWGPWERRQRSYRWIDLLSVLELEDPRAQLAAELHRISLLVEKGEPAA